MIPTLAADSAVSACLQSLDAQTERNFEVIVVDNSGEGRARLLLPEHSPARVIENKLNVGFGGAVNQGIESSQSAFVATLNDDAVAHPDWLRALLRAVESRPEIGMCASRVQLHQGMGLDSAGMLISSDASSTQRGHGVDASLFSRTEEALFPSGSAALYRRAMLAEIGSFDADFFLYCEDTDLGLRAIWAGWRCLYVADAIVEHRYSHSAGRASALKAYYVERNRLRVGLKSFPLLLLAVMPWASLVRYFWHLLFLLQGKGKAAEFARGGAGGAKLAWYVMRAHIAAILELPRLLQKRRMVRATARISSAEFARTLRRHSISAKKVAAH